jgi:hypothetical protein
MKAVFETSKLWMTESKAILHYAHCIKRFSETITTLTKAECEPALSTIEPVCGLLERWSSLCERIADEEMRVSDDLRDIFERFQVVLRTTEARKESIEDLTAAQRKVKDYQMQMANDAKKPSFVQAKADAQMAKLQDARKKALIIAKNLTSKLINERVKFRKFHFRRLKHALQHVGRTMTATRSEEVEILRRLIEALRAARAGQVASFPEEITVPEVPIPVIETPKTVEAPRVEQKSEAVEAVPIVIPVAPVEEKAPEPTGVDFYTSGAAWEQAAASDPVADLQREEAARNARLFQVPTEEPAAPAAQEDTPEAGGAEASPAAADDPFANPFDF